MRPYLCRPASHISGKVSLLGDKSIAHRAVILSSIAKAKTKIKNFPFNDDCLFTANALEKLGVKIVYSLNKTQKKSGLLVVYGAGLRGLKPPPGPVFIGDSGTTLRLISAVLAGQNFQARLLAGKSLSKRPMSRITIPLRKMGALIKSKVKGNEEYAPLQIRGNNLKGIVYKMPVASAQVKSAIILAGLYADGLTKVIERIKTRDHTERMLKLFNADIEVTGKKIVIKGNRELISPKTIIIPNDVSSASFFVVLGTIIPDSKLLIPQVGLNPLRAGFIEVLKRMGADIKATGFKPQLPVAEPIGDLRVRSSVLKGTAVKRQEIPSLIDELPILITASCFAQGKTIFAGVRELRVKETDRIRSMTENLKKMGADIQVIKTDKSEDIIVNGVKELRGAEVKSFGDHRTAMSLIVAGLSAKGQTVIDDIDCINKSFPNFLGILKQIVYY